MAVAPRTRLFIGYSSVDTSIKQTQYTDLDLIKRDLVNAFYTRKRERVMRPDFGSIIWDMLFEPMVADNLQMIIDDCYQIVAADGRVQIRDIKLTEYDNGLQLQMDLYYQPLDIVEVFQIDFDRRNVETNII